LINEEWVTPDGKTVIRDYYKKDVHGKLTKTGWWLSDHQGIIHQFATIEPII
jgi:poly(glycerol-phosphate) alpha-glucosyltransferase